MEVTETARAPCLFCSLYNDGEGRTDREVGCELPCFCFVFDIIRERVRTLENGERKGARACQKRRPKECMYGRERWLEE